MVKMVLCPPFMWSLKGGYDLKKKDPETEKKPSQRRDTISKIDPESAIGPGCISNERPSHPGSDEVPFDVKKSSTTISCCLSDERPSHPGSDDLPFDIKKSSTATVPSRSSDMSMETAKSSNSRDSDTETIDSSEGNPGRKITCIIHEDSNKVERRKRIALPPPIHIDVTDLEYVKYEKSEQSMEQIKAAIMDNDFLNNLMVYERLKMVTEAMNCQEFSAGSLIIRQGESGSHLYVSAEGQFEVLKGGQVVNTFGAGVAFGELAILYRAKRFASIRCITPAKVWTLERRIFQKIMVRSGRQEQDDNIRFLESVPLLKNMHHSNLLKISECLKREFFTGGTAIVRQGDRGDTFYIIRGGKAVVTKRDGDDKEREVARLERGDYFGEQALLHADRRLATVTALPPGLECLTLDRTNFTGLIGSLPELEKHPEPRISHADGTITKNRVFSKYNYVKLSDLKILGTLGVGGFGRVELVRYMPDPNLTFALKCLKKIDVVQQQQQENAYNEKHIMIDCSDSEFICKLFGTFKDNKYIYFLMEPILGGDVWTILQKRGFFPENIARFMVACVVEAFQFLHSRNIIYRDLKPENLMMDKDGYIKLVDFGFAKKISSDSKTWTFAGTPEYVAPEIVLNKGHDRAVDCWTLGVFLHELLVGRPPFKAPGSHMKTYMLILKGIDSVVFHSRVSNSAKELICKLCRTIPAERLGYLKNGIADIKRHRWFLGFDWEALQDRKMKAPLILPIANNRDRTHFENYPNKDKVPPPDETSGWDIDF